MNMVNKARNEVGQLTFNCDATLAIELHPTGYLLRQPFSVTISPG